MVELAGLIKQCDFLAYQPEIYIHKGESTKYKTAFGGIMSILIVILTVMATFGFGIDIINRRNPSVVLNRNYANYPNLTITQDFLLSFGLFFDKGVLIDEIDTLVDIYFIYAITNPSAAYKNESVVTENKLQFVPCNTTDMLKQDYLKVKESLYADAGYYYCLPNGFNKPLEGEYGAPKFADLQLRIDICQNTTTKTNCKPDRYIREKMSLLFLHFLYTDTYQDSSDFSQPIKTVLLSSLLKGASTTYRRDYLIYRLVDYLTDSGWILSDEKTQNSYQVSSFNNDVAPNPETQIFYNIIVSLNAIKDIYNRQYVKLQNIAANVGGIIKFFFVFLKIIIIYVTKIPLIESLYDKYYTEIDNFKRKVKSQIQSNIAEEMLNTKTINNYFSSATDEKQNNFKLTSIQKISKDKNSYYRNTKKLSTLSIIFFSCSKKSKFSFNRVILKDYKSTYDIENVLTSLKKVNTLYDHLYDTTEQRILELENYYKLKKNSIEKKSNIDDDAVLGSLLNNESRKEFKTKLDQNFIDHFIEK